jgi:hypothetical protein
LKTSIGLFPLLLLLAAASAQAQTPINMNTANNGAPTIGDFPGWPITIYTPGHYVLTSHLNAPLGASAIEIRTAGVTLDLNGYTVSGSMGCSVETGQVQCTGSNNATGIFATFERTVIRNGTVRGFGNAGIQISSGAVEDVFVEQNGGTGISISQSQNGHLSRVSRVTVTLNRGAGVATRNALIERALISKNVNGVVGQRFTLIDSRVIGNTDAGIHDNAPNAVWRGALKGTVVDSNGEASIQGGLGVSSLGGNLIDGVAF